MKKMVLWIVMLSGLAFLPAIVQAQSEENPFAPGVENTVGITAVQGQQTTVNGPGFANSSAGASASAKSGDPVAVAGLDFHPTYNSTYPENHAQPVNPGHAAPPWWMPSESQICLWNSAASDLMAYERVWTMEEVKYILKQAGESGFTCSTAFLDKILPTSRIEVRLAPTPIGKTVEGILFVGISHRDASKANSWKGDVNVRGSKSKVFMSVLAKALKLAMEKGGEFAIINSGMNVSYNGLTISPGVGVGSAGIQNSFSLIGSIASTEAIAKGEAVVKLSVYRHDGVVPASIPIIGPEKSDEKKKEVNEPGKIDGVKVSPEILSMEEVSRSPRWNVGDIADNEILARSQSF